jgi:hypothetical protein
MTESDFQIIERVAKIHGLTVHDAEQEFCIKRRITDKSDPARSVFYWEENEGFEEFFKQIYTLAYDAGYDVAARN